MTEEEEMERRKEERVRSEHYRVMQMRLQQLYERYGTVPQRDRTGTKDTLPNLEEAPDVLRLG